MKRFCIFALAAMMFAACATDDTQDVQFADAPETLTVGFEGGDDDTRVQLNEAGKTVWTKGDLVSVFYRSDANQKWQFQGETGERIADLYRVDAGSATETMRRVVVVYPYNENYYINTETYNVQASLPATQHYLADSYGLDGNLMISSGEYNNISLKSVCGWLKLQLVGNGEKVQSITLKGNNGEQVAGELYINSADATAMLSSDKGSGDDGETGGAGGGLVFEDTILKEVTLDCGNGVTLGTEATAFYIALPPQTFEKGLTVEIEDAEGLKMKKSTFNTLSIERNCIQPMTEFEYSPNIPHNNQIWYTNGSTTKATTPYDTSVFGANIVSNLYDAEKEHWVITFDGDVTEIGKHAFDSCRDLTNISIPESVKIIGEQAFLFANIQELYLPDGLETIEEYAFQQCNSILGTIYIPQSVTNIGHNSNPFDGSVNFKGFAGKFASADGRCLIDDGILKSFATCGLTSYSIPNGVKIIGQAAFAHASNLTNIIIPEGVEEILGLSFIDCAALSSVIIPSTIKAIYGHVFVGCNNLSKIYVLPTTPPKGSSSMFENSAPDRKIYVPASDDDSIINAYKEADGWSYYADYIEEYDFSAEQ